MLPGRHNQGFKTLLEQFCGLSIRQHATTETSRTLSNSPVSDDFVQSTPASREPGLPPPERYVGDPGTCHPFLSQYSLIFELQPSSFPSDYSRITYLIKLTSGRAVSWAMRVWEQQSAVCLRLKDVMAEVFDSPASGREAAGSYFDYDKNPVVWKTMQ